MKEFKIAGMKCENCVAKIVEALKTAGYGDAQVTLDPPMVKLASPAVTSEELQKVLQTAGDYKVATADGHPPTPHASAHED